MQKDPFFKKKALFISFVPNNPVIFPEADTLGLADSHKCWPPKIKTPPEDSIYRSLSHTCPHHSLSTLHCSSFIFVLAGLLNEYYPQIGLPSITEP